MERPLAALALRPHPREEVLVVVPPLDVLEVHAHLPRLARPADGAPLGGLHRRPARQALRVDPREPHDPAGRLARRHDRDVPRVRPLREALRRVDDALEEAPDRQRELVVEVVLRVDRDVVLEHVDRVLRLLVELRALRALHDDVGDAVPDDRRVQRVAPPDALDELDVRLLARVRVLRLGERLGDDQVRDVEPVHEQVGDGPLDVGDGLRDAAVDEDVVQDRADDVRDERAVVPADGLDALHVELVVGLRPRPEQPGVALLVHEHVREVDLLELEADGPREGLRDGDGGLPAEPHRRLEELAVGAHPLGAVEVDHDGVGVAVDDGRVPGVPVRLRVLPLDDGLRLVDHSAPVGGDGGADLEAAEAAELRPREAVHAVRADLERVLAAVQDGVLERVLGLRHGLLRELPRAEELVQDFRENAVELGVLDEAVARGGARVLRVVEELRVARADEGRVAEVVRHHDRGVQRGEVERRDGLLVKAPFGLDDGRALEAGGVVGARGPLAGREEQLAVFGLSEHLRKDLDLLAALDEPRDWDPRDSGHFDVVDEEHELLDEPKREKGVLGAVHGEAAARLSVPILQVSDDGVVHVLLLFTEEVLGNTVERVRAQFVVLLDAGDDVEDDPAVANEVFEETVSGLLGAEAFLFDRGALIIDSAPRAECVRELQGCGTVD